MMLSSKFVKINGIKTHYLEAGDGEPIVLVHGGGPGASAWAGWRNTIPALAKHYRVLAIDLIGNGYTDKPLIQYTHQTLVDHLAGFIDTLCLDKVRVMGNSMGAYVTTKWSLDHPNQVVANFAISTATVATAMGIKQIPTPGFKALGEYDGSAQNLRDFLGVITNTPIEETIVNERVSVSQLPGALEHLKSMSQHRKELQENPNERQLFSMTDRLPHINFPMIIVWGEEDRFAPVSLAYELQKRLPNIPVKIIPNAGHQCQNDQVDLVNQLAVEFFSALTAPETIGLIE